MINQVTRDRINSLSEKYRKLAIKHKEAIKELTLSELPEMVYNSNAIENSTLTLEDTEDILILGQILLLLLVLSQCLLFLLLGL